MTDYDIQIFKDELINDDIQLQIFKETLAERKRQDEKFGPQSYELKPKCISNESWIRERDQAQYRCEYNAEVNSLSWYDIIIEELYEACAEDDIEKQYYELLQTHAVILHALEDMKKKIDRIKGDRILEDNLLSLGCC